MHKPSSASGWTQRYRWAASFLKHADDCCLLKHSICSTFKRSLSMKTVSIIFIASLLLLAGCNTVKGVGQDVQKAGSVLENAAKK